MHTRKMAKWVAAASVAALFTLALPTQAQQTPPGDPAPGAQAETPVGEATLQKFAVVFAEVMDLQQEFAVQLENVESNEKARAMQQDVREQMVEVVQASGMSLQEYNDVASQIDRDPQLRQRVMNMLDSGQ